MYPGTSPDLTLAIDWLLLFIFNKKTNADKGGGKGLVKRYPPLLSNGLARALQGGLVKLFLKVNKKRALLTPPTQLNSTQLLSTPLCTLGALAQAPILR